MGEYPKCKSKMIPIIYTNHTEDGFRSDKRREIILGGCCIIKHSPNYCPECYNNLKQEHNRLIFDKTDKLIYN